VKDMQQRVLSVDVLRGLTLALMIVVNMSISEEKSYAPLLHATWHGLTLTDLVFPSFLFAVGASLSLSMAKNQGLATSIFLVQVFKRTVLIFLCGYLLYWFPFFEFTAQGQWQLLPLANTRILGVLQRIALAYGAAALIVHFLKLKGAALFSALALLANWWVLAAAGDYTLQGNAALKLDVWALGASHLYKGEGIAFDPEGLLGTLPAIVNVLAGYAVGSSLHMKRPDMALIRRFLMWAALALICGAMWAQVFPVNKKLWTSSYVLISIGFDLALFALLLYWTDLKASRGWTYFFEVFGKNTLFIYLLAELGMSVLWLVHIGPMALFDWIFTNGFAHWAGDKNGSLLFAVMFMLLCWCLAYGLDKKRIYIKL